MRLNTYHHRQSRFSFGWLYKERYQAHANLADVLDKAAKKGKLIIKRRCDEKNIKS